jgi:regulator of sigma E protease
MTLTGVFIFFVILLVLVLFHEAGHFWAARFVKVGVREFAFGFPPRLLSIVRGGTRYSFNLIPLGGYVRLEGEERSEEAPDGFWSASLPRRMVIVLAGVAANMLLAVLLFTLSAWIGSTQIIDDAQAGRAVVADQRLFVASIQENSPAAVAGLTVGGEILSINGERVVSSAELERVKNEQEDLLVVIEKDNLESSFLIARTDTNELLGLSYFTVADVRYQHVWSVINGFRTTSEVTTQTVVGLARIFGRLFTRQSTDGELTSIIGIAYITQDVADTGIRNIIPFAAILSVNLGLMNLLPLPVLDGGRFVLLLYELVRRRPMSERLEGYIQQFSIVLLLALFVFVTYKDIIRLF